MNISNQRRGEAENGATYFRQRALVEILDQLEFGDTPIAHPPYTSSVAAGIAQRQRADGTFDALITLLPCRPELSLRGLPVALYDRGQLLPLQRQKITTRDQVLFRQLRPGRVYVPHFSPVTRLLSDALSAAGTSARVAWEILEAGAYTLAIPGPVSHRAYVPAAYRFETPDHRSAFQRIISEDGAVECTIRGKADAPEFYFTTEREEFAEAVVRFGLLEGDTEIATGYVTFYPSYISERRQWTAHCPGPLLLESPKKELRLAVEVLPKEAVATTSAKQALRKALPGGQAESLLNLLGEGG